MLETVWIKHVLLLDFKNNKTYRLDITLVEIENVIRCMTEGELRKLVINQDGKSPMIVTYALDTALVYIGDVFFLCQKKRVRDWRNSMRDFAKSNKVKKYKKREMVLLKRYIEFPHVCEMINEYKNKLRETTFITFCA